MLVPRKAALILALVAQVLPISASSAEVLQVPAGQAHAHRPSHDLGLELDKSAGHPESPDEWELLPSPEPLAGRFQPLVQRGPYGLVPSQHFLDLAPTLSLMNYLSYQRGANYRYGHDLTLGNELAGWSLHNIPAMRGFVFRDPNAGFVAHNRARNEVAIVLHGSINMADWVSNLSSVGVRLDSTPGPDGSYLPLVGRAHKGFLDKYLSCNLAIMEEVDRILDSLPPEERAETKFYVSGHSQGAALGQLLTAHLCQHLRRHYGADFINAKANRVHAWLLSSPTGLDHTAATFAEAIVGKTNLVVQNTWLDPVPNVGMTPEGRQFRAVGTPVMQSSADALARAGKAHLNAVGAHLANGDVQSGLAGLLPANPVKNVVAAYHMASDNVNYRGVGNNLAFDPDMVVKDGLGITEGLRQAEDHQASKERSWWDRLTSFF